MELPYLLKTIEKGRRRISSIIPVEGSFDERGAPGIRSGIIASMSQVENNLARLIPCASRSGLTG